MAEIISFHGHWLAAEVFRLGKQLRAHSLADLFPALDVLEDNGIDPRDRRAVKRALGRANVVPVRFRGNRDLYERFID